MSRCRSCNCILSDFELTRKSVVTGEYFDLCGACFATIRDDVHYRERIDLKDNSDDYENSSEDRLDNLDYLQYP